MSVRQVLKNTTEETPIPIIVNNDTGIFLLQSYVRGYQVYMNIWNETINDFLQCKIQEINEFDHWVVSLLHDDCLEENVVGHVPIKNILSFFETSFLQYIGSCYIIGKRVNRGAGVGLEIPVRYKFFGDKRAVSWAENQVIKKLKKL